MEKMRRRKRVGTAGQFLRAVQMLGAALLAAAPCLGQEQVRIQVPEGIVFPVMDLKSKAAAPASRLSFDHAQLARGHRLRVSVRAERPDRTGAEPRIFFRSANVRGGTGFSGPLRETEDTVIFESDPLAFSGGAEILWTLEPLDRLERASAYAVILRWKIESVPGRTEPGQGGPVSRGPFGPAASRSCLGAASCGPGSAAPDGPRGERLPPAQ